MNKITRRQAAIIGAYTGIVCGPFEDMHEYIDSLPGFKGIMTHQLGDGVIADVVSAAAKADFLAICPSREDPLV